MKRLVFAIAMTALACVAQSPDYQSTSGDVTLSVFAWISSAPAPLQGILHQAPPVVNGTWITACTTNPSTRNLKAAILFKTGMEVTTLVEDFAFLKDTGTGSGMRCGNILKLIERKAIVSVSVITASEDFPLPI